MGVITKNKYPFVVVTNECINNIVLCWFVGVVYFQTISAPALCGGAMCYNCVPANLYHDPKPAPV